MELSNRIRYIIHILRKANNSDQVEANHTLKLLN